MLIPLRLILHVFKFCFQKKIRLNCIRAIGPFFCFGPCVCQCWRPKKMEMDFSTTLPYEEIPGAIEAYSNLINSRSKVISMWEGNEPKQQQLTAQQAWDRQILEQLKSIKQ